MGFSTLQLTLFAMALSLFAAGLETAPGPTPLQHLGNLVAAASSDSLASELAVAAVDAGPAALPMLRFHLRSRDSKGRGLLAAAALAYIGGEEAVDLLRRRFSAPYSVEARVLLALAFASTGRPHERALLVRWLDGEHYGDEWTPIVAAALSLGVLRETDAIPALIAAGENADSIAGNAAREAVRWMREGSWSVSTGDEDVHPAIVAVLANGVPSTDRADVFYDPERDSCWFRASNVWQLSKRDCDVDAPRLRFGLHVSPDGRRALISVGLTFGSLDGIGYDYVVSQVGNVWRVQGVMFTWIS